MPISVAGLVLSSINLGTTLVTAAILLRLLEQSTIDVSAVSPDGTCTSGLQSPLIPIRPSELPGLYHDEQFHQHLQFCKGSTTVPGFIISYLKSSEIKCVLHAAHANIHSVHSRMASVQTSPAEVWWTGGKTANRNLSWKPSKKEWVGKCWGQVGRWQESQYVVT